MDIELDQSGKVENTNRDTVVAFGNKNVSESIAIRGQDKRELQKFFRHIGKPNMFNYRIFVVLIFLLIKDDLEHLDRIVIDTEYPGKEAMLKSLLMQHIRVIMPSFPADNIVFARVGKKSPAHAAAHKVFTGKKPPDITVSAQQLLRIFSN